MRYLTLILMFILTLFVITPYANAANLTDMEMEKINLEVNQKFDHIPNNCLIVAKEKQRLLLKYGVDTEIVVIQPAFATMKHAVLHVDGKILDNGDIANNIFDRDELRYFGRVL